jgi:hypothetical protein
MTDPHDAPARAEPPARRAPTPGPPSESVELEVGALEATLPPDPERQGASGAERHVPFPSQVPARPKDQP